MSATPKRMNDLFDLYEKEHLPTLSARVQRDYLGMIKYLREIFGHRKPWKVRPKHVAKLMDVTVARVQANRKMMILSSIFKIAQGSWLIDRRLENPCLPVKRHKTKPRDRYISHEEFVAFRATAPEQIQIAMDFAYLLGQRQSDITQMKWEQIHTDGERATWEIHIDQGKTGKKLAIKISESVEAVLARAMRTGDQFLLTSDAVIRNKFGRAYTPDSFRALWQKYMRAWRKAHPDEPKWTFHDIRAKTVSDSKTVTEASERAGHADMKITLSTYKRNRLTVSPLL